MAIIPRVRGVEKTEMGWGEADTVNEEPETDSKEEVHSEPEQERKSQERKSQQPMGN